MGRKYTVWASGWNSFEYVIPKPYPDLGVYLASLWEQDLNPVIVARGVDNWPDSAPLYPHVTVDWPDDGTIGQATLARLVDTIIDYMEKGRQVEIGCFGGHGRTGTLLAALIGRVEHMQVQRAVRAVRARYCEDAVETSGQIRMLAQYLGAHTHEAFPEPSLAALQAWTGRSTGLGNVITDTDGHKYRWDNELQSYVLVEGEELCVY